MSGQTELAQMRLAASRRTQALAWTRVVRAIGVKQEVQRGSVGVKVGLIIEQQWIFMCISRRAPSSGDTCAPQ